MFQARESFLLTGTTHPSDVVPLGQRVRSAGQRRLGGGAGSFGGVAFGFRRALRHADEKVIVEVDPDLGAAELASLVEAVAVHEVAQLALGSTLCRARAVGWEPGTRCLVFELHRAGTPATPDAPVSHERVTAANDTEHAAALSWGGGEARPATSG